MIRKHFSLLSRESATSPWGIEFGDFDRAIVEDERQDLIGSGHRPSNTKIIATSAQQAAIDAEVSKLNSSRQLGTPAALAWPVA